MKSNYERNRALDGRYGGGTYTKATTVYCALGTAASVSSFTEVAYTGYARVAKTNNATNFPNAVNGQKSNGTMVEFPERAAGGGAVEATHFAWFDAETGGNMMDFNALQQTEPKPITVGDIPRFGAGVLIWQET